MRLMIGVGNPLRCDDRLGLYLAQMLGNGWTIITAVQLLPEHAEPIARADRVIFLDASEGNAPGEVVSERVLPVTSSGAFTHRTDPPALLRQASELYGHSPPAILITVVGGSFGYGDHFSPIIETKIPEILRQVRDRINQFITASG